MTFRGLRLQLGVTQTTLAERAFSAQGIVSLIERGELQPPPDLQARLAVAFGVTYNDLARALAETKANPPKRRCYYSPPRHRAQVEAPDVHVNAHIETNREAQRRVGDRPVCEWSPERDKLARLGDPFHAFASRTMGVKGHGQVHVCVNCFERIACDPTLGLRRRLADEDVA